MNIYDELINKVSKGERFKIDFNLRNLLIGKDFLIKDGAVKDGYEIEDSSLEEIENTFEDYYYSRPSERSEKNVKSYFKAINYDDMTDEQLICGKPREVERAKLECKVLGKILHGFNWKDEYGNWYWKSKRFPQLVILRQWV